MLSFPQYGVSVGEINKHTHTQMRIHNRSNTQTRIHTRMHIGAHSRTHTISLCFFISLPYFQWLPELNLVGWPAGNGDSGYSFVVRADRFSRQQMSCPPDSSATHSISSAFVLCAMKYCEIFSLQESAMCFFFPWIFSLSLHLSSTLAKIDRKIHSWRTG